MKRHMLVEAAAKINLSLSVVGKRQDGYHLLETIMQSVSLRDKLDITWDSGGKGIVIVSDGDGIPLDDNNTCSKAARLWQQETGISGGLSIIIEKNIPMQAGLGGGSTDAAAVLHSLNLIHGEPLNQIEMNRLAARTGADVPFCLRGGIGFCQGIGEIITRLSPMPARQILLVKPVFGLSTPAVFNRLNWQSENIVTDHNNIIEAVRRGSWELLGETSFNVLQQPASELRPEMKFYLQRLQQTSAQMVMMSGSGTCVYAVYKNEKDLSAAKNFILKDLKDSDWAGTAKTCDQGLRILEFD